VSFPSSGPNSLVQRTPDPRAGPAPTLVLGLCRYLIAAIVLSPLLPVGRGMAQAVAEVQVTPETMTLGVGQRQPLFATAFDQRGNLIPSAKFTFRSSDTLIAQVLKDGTVIGVKPGLAKIEALSQGRRASMAVLITGGTSNPTSRTSSSATVLTLEPASVTLFPGESVRIRAQALRDDGTPVSVGRVTVKSLRPEIARVDSGGLVTGLAPGRTIIQAASGRLMATLPVEVTQAEFVVIPRQIVLVPEQTDTIRAVVPSQGNRQVSATVQWSSTDPAIVSVNAGGVVRAHRAGRADVIAAAHSQERRTSVTVHQVPDALVVTPPQGGLIQVPLRSTRSFTAVAESADSTPIPEAQISWELSDTSVATFDRTTGVLTPKMLGTTTLTARIPGINPAVWTIRVVAGEITVEPTKVGLLVAQRASFSAVLRDWDVSSSPARTPGVSWSSDRPDVAQVRENGQVEALSLGHAVITATMPWGKKATADVFVVGDLLVSSNRAGAYGIYQLRAAGSLGVVPVLTDSASNVQAMLSPDRTRIVFSSNRNGQYDLYAMDPAGSNLRRLTTATGHEGEPTWTPDATRIVYTATTGTVSHIAIMSSEGAENRQLTTASGGNHSASVSPDGRTIAFVSARDGNHAIYTMGIDGSNQRRLTRGSGRETSPRYTRNGDLFYVTERGGGSRGSKVMRMASGGGASSQVLQTDEPVTALAVSREGDRLAYIVGRIRDASKGRVDFSLYLQSTTPGRPAVPVPLQPGEQISSLSF
jgi:Tol biopolymer transport system component